MTGNTEVGCVFGIRTDNLMRPSRMVSNPWFEFARDATLPQTGCNFTSAI
jgi:hypothetical protein